MTHKDKTQKLQKNAKKQPMQNNTMQNKTNSIDFQTLTINKTN
jgi:hypothetical protein